MMDNLNTKTTIYMQWLNKVLMCEVGELEEEIPIPAEKVWYMQSHDKSCLVFF
jgi:hypothetical protein